MENPTFDPTNDPTNDPINDPTVDYWPRRLPSNTYAFITRLLLLQWTVAAVAESANVCTKTVYRILANLFTYGQARPPSIRRRGCPRKITVAASQALEKQIRKTPWMYQDEMVEFLWEEHGINAHQSTVSRLLKRLKLSRKASRRVSSRQNEALRRAWRAEMVDLKADQLVCVDEASFNERSGWRQAVYAPIGNDGRHTLNARVGKTWSILPAYTIEGYLPCTGIKEGHYNTEEFYLWIGECLNQTR